MTDLERLTEAQLVDVLQIHDDGYALSVDEIAVLAIAARAYRDLLANGQRVEPDYEAGAEALYHATVGGNADEMEPFGTFASDVVYRTRARLVVDAALAGLSVYPKEAEK